MPAAAAWASSSPKASRAYATDTPPATMPTAGASGTVDASDASGATHASANAACCAGPSAAAASPPPSNISLNCDNTGSWAYSQAIWPKRRLISPWPS